MEAHVETDQEYTERVLSEDMTFIYLTLQECLKGNVNESTVNKAIALAKKHK